MSAVSSSNVVSAIAPAAIRTMPAMMKMLLMKMSHFVPMLSSSSPLCVKSEGSC